MPGTSRCGGIARFIFSMSDGFEICPTISVAERSSFARSPVGRKSGVSATRKGMGQPTRSSRRPM